MAKIALITVLALLFGPAILLLSLGLVLNPAAQASCLPATSSSPSTGTHLRHRARDLTRGLPAPGRVVDTLEWVRDARPSDHRRTQAPHGSGPVSQCRHTHRRRCRRTRRLGRARQSGTDTSS